MEDNESSDEKLFKPLAGLKLVYEPEGGVKGEGKKHPCPDCRFCQFCCDARCHSCRGKKNAAGKSPARKLSLCEQIRLYEEVNAKVR